MNETTHPVTVDYSMALDRMIALGRFQGPCEGFTSERFPIKGTGAVQAEIILIHFGYEIGTRRAEKELDEKDLRPTDIEELLALAAQQPELQRHFPIVALGSPCIFCHQLYVPVLFVFQGQRKFYLSFVGHKWVSTFRFASVRK